MEKRKELKIYDILILTVILFGQAIYTSTVSLLNPVTGVTYSVESFTASDNIYAFTFQFVLLIIALIYLKIRKFDFSVWNMKISFKAILKGILIFVFVAILFDIYYILIGYIFPTPNVEDVALTGNNFINHIKTIDYTIIVYSLLNGFYEEIFFLGICLACNSKYRIPMFIYSLIIRYSFHTYQGHISAISIGFILGTAFYFLYTKSKDKNLTPFFIAHAIGDIMGVCLLCYLY